MSSDRPRPRFIPPADVLPRPAPGEEPIVWFEMPGGLQVGLRPIHPDDRQALMEGFQALSEESRYHRFLSPMPRLSDRQARYLTELDQIDHFAWGIGIRGDAGAIEGIGVARYVRDPADRDTAEVAVAITDPYHGLGLGTLAVQALAVVAAIRGIEVLTGYLLGDNKPMVRIFQGMGATFTHAGPGLVRAEAVLQDDAPGTLGEEACAELIRVAARASHPSAPGSDDPNQRG
ncbi:MAG: GNAT family N-acetyltransferase [Actinobacteria bacterium]|nr:GNAT family N-acetyltransferase [Actinomycetota bacterium]